MSRCTGSSSAYRFATWLRWRRLLAPPARRAPRRRTGVTALRAALAQTTLAQSATALRRQRADAMDAFLAYAALYGREAAGSAMSALRVGDDGGQRGYVTVQMGDGAGGVSVQRIQIQFANAEDLTRIDEILIAAGIAVCAPHADRISCSDWSATIGTVGEHRLCVRAYQQNAFRFITVDAANNDGLCCLPRAIADAEVGAALVRFARQALRWLSSSSPPAATEVSVRRHGCALKVAARRTRRHLAKAYLWSVARAHRDPTRMTLLTYAPYALRLLDAVTPRPGEYAYRAAASS